MRFLHFLFFITLALFTGCLTDTDTTPLPNNNYSPDTTSHEFIWKIDTIGTSGTYLNAVDIYDENNIWAVGEIHTEDTDIPDSNGNLIPPYNAVHWDGVKFNFIRFKYKFQESERIIPWLHGILVISNYNIWLASGSIFHYDGNATSISYERNQITGEIVQHLWGNLNGELWGVGKQGVIVYYNSVFWRNINSTTSSEINDVWGFGGKIMCTVSNRNNPELSRLLSLNKSSAFDTLNWTSNSRLNSVWFSSNSSVYVGGDGLFMNQDTTWKEIDIPNYYVTRIRGSDNNNIFVVGDFGLCVHYNGSSWKDYPELIMQNGSLQGLDVTQNIMAAVGDINVGELNSRGLLIRCTAKY